MGWSWAHHLVEGLLLGPHWESCWVGHLGFHWEIHWGCHWDSLMDWRMDSHLEKNLGFH